MGCENFAFEAETFGDGSARRVKRVTADVALSSKTPRTDRKGTVPPLCCPDGSRYIDTDRGHLIALEFGGPERSENLVPMYGGFNGKGGIWRQFEDTLAKLCFKNKVHVDIRVRYPDKSHGVPSKFHVRVTRGTEVLHEELLPHKLLTPLPIKFTNDEQLLIMSFEEYDKEMKKEMWLIEDAKIVPPGIGNKKLNVGPFDADKLDIEDKETRQTLLATRPYAALDYMLLRNSKAWDSLKLTKGFSSSKLLNTTNFAPAQIRMIHIINASKNKRLIKSDLKASKHELYKGALNLSSTDSAPQIDHIFPKSHGGSNTFSNARVASASLNKMLNNKKIAEEVTDEVYHEIKKKVKRA